MTNYAHYSLQLIIISATLKLGTVEEECAQLGVGLGTGTDNRTSILPVFQT